MKFVNYNVRPISDIRDMIRTSVSLYGSQNAFLEKRNGKYDPVTYNEYFRDVRGLGTALYDAARPERRIAVIGENCYMWAVSYMAVICGLGVVVPIDREATPDDIKNIVTLSLTDTLLYADSVAAKVKEIEGVRKIAFSELRAVIEDGAAKLESGVTAYDELPIDPFKMSVLLFTSGTTGVAKGVMLSHHNIAFDLMAMCKMINLQPEDTFLSVLPLHHTYECTCGFLCPLYRGATIAYCEKLSTITRDLQDSGATIMLAVPLLLETMYKKIWQNAEKSGRAATLRRAIKLNNAMKKIGIDLSRKLFAEIHKTFGGHLRLLISGGAAIDPKVLAGLRDMGFLALQGYGLTECAPLAAVNRDTFYKDASAGLAPPDTQLAIDEPDEDGIGEIKYKGDNIMLGYYNMPEETSEIIRDGWFYTGDLGYIDSEGFLFITGRKKNVIVTENGKNIFPEEIEYYLGRDARVLDSMVIGEKSAAGETIIKAIIYPDYALVNAEVEAKGISTTDINATEYRDAVKSIFVAMINELNLSLPSFKRIRKFVIRREDFEKTTTKKIKRHAKANLDESGQL
jgi:long-chain acyl-CoA synthetase